MIMDKYLVLDVGGSSIKYAIMTKEAEFLKKGKVPTPKEKIEDFVEVIGKIYDEFKDEIKGMAMSLPGLIDSERGYAYTGGNLLYNNQKEIVKILQERCPIKITIENDAKCAALAEVWRGSLKDCRDGIVVVLGTGIGGAVIKDRKVHKGKHFFAGEFSFIRTDINDPDNLDNIWARKSGSSALIKAAADVKGLKEEDLDGYKGFEYINNGDEDVLKVLDDFTKTIAVQIINLGCVFDPEKVSIGGGISSQPILIEYINKNLKESYDAISELGDFPQIKVEKCTFENDSNLIGALYNYFTLDSKMNNL